MRGSHQRTSSRPEGMNVHVPTRADVDLARQDDVRTRALRGMPPKGSSLRERVANGSGIADRGVPCLRRGWCSCAWGASRAPPGASERHLLAWGSAGRRVTEWRSSLVVEASVASLPCGVLNPRCCVVALSTTETLLMSDTYPWQGCEQMRVDLVHRLVLVAVSSR